MDVEGASSSTKGEVREADDESGKGAERRRPLDADLNRGRGGDLGRAGRPLLDPSIGDDDDSCPPSPRSLPLGTSSNPSARAAARSGLSL